MMPPPGFPDEKHWHVDRRVPLSIIMTLLFTFAGQTGTIVWFVSKLDGRVEMLEKAQVTMAPQGDRLTRVETKLESVQDGISEIKSILRRDSAPAKSR